MKKYISAEMQIIKMSANDIIATSATAEPTALYEEETGAEALVQGRRGIWD